MPASPASDPWRVSVIIPTHDRLQVLPRAIDSVRAQHYPVHELIVVDDGSGDGTAEWLTRHAPDVQLITQNNHGVSHARNRGIEQATGEWIALLDSDDAWYPQKLERQMTALHQAPHHRLCHCDEHWIRNGRRVNPHRKHRKHGGEIFAHCLPLCCISPSAAVLHRSLLEEVGLFDESLPACEDYDLWLRICARDAVLYVDEALLQKTGGHDDQLSQRYPAMDRFRLQALAGMLCGDVLSAQQRSLAQAMFEHKARIYINGARKRQRMDAANEILTRYADLLPPENILGVTR